MPRNNNENNSGLVIIFLTIMAIINLIILMIIYVSRVLFWVSLVGIVIAISSSIYFSIIYSKNKEDYLFNSEDNSGWIALISVGAILVLYLFSGLCYNLGYSEQAIKTEMEAKSYLSWYNEFVNIPDQAIDETINSLCQDPNYPCQEAKTGYGVYKEVTKWKDVADTVSTVLVTANRISNRIK